MAIPKAFISYSHDSQEHKKWVLDFATRLRNTGVDAILDQWDLKPGDDVALFMERNLVAADRILMGCSDNYVAKANAGTGGVGYEKMIVTADLMKAIDSNKVVPVIRQAGTHHVPTFLRSKLFLDFSRNDQFEVSFDDLVRAVHGAPLFVKPPVGNNPFARVSDTPAQRTGDAVQELMRVVTMDFENGKNYSEYKDLRLASSMSRVMLDHTINAAVSDGLIHQYKSGAVQLTDKGKHYAVTHGLDRAKKESP